MLANLPTTEPDLVLIAGDWHGDSERACEIVELAAAVGAPAVLQLGDFGYPPIDAEAYLDAIEESCRRTGVRVLFIDGNRDNHDHLETVPVCPDTGLRRFRDHVHHLPRGRRWIWHGRTWLALGGAFTVNRPDYVRGVTWWPQETLTDGDVTRSVTAGAADVMLVHDCPDGTGIIERIRIADFDAASMAHAQRHRERLAGVVDAVEPMLLFHGHYHVRYDTDRSLPRGGATQVLGLSDNRHALEDNVVLVRTRTLTTSPVPAAVGRR